MKLTTDGEWVTACAGDALEPEEALRFDHGGRTFVIIRSSDGAYFAIDGHCSHERSISPVALSTAISSNAQSTVEPSTTEQARHARCPRAPICAAMKLSSMAATS